MSAEIFIIVIVIAWWFVEQRRHVLVRRQEMFPATVSSEFLEQGDGLSRPSDTLAVTVTFDRGLGTKTFVGPAGSSSELWREARRWVKNERIDLDYRRRDGRYLSPYTGPI